MNRLTTEEEYPHGAEGRSADKLTGHWCRGVFEATACVEKLARYENTGLEPEQIRELDKLYLEKCLEVTALRDQQRWIPVAEWLPDLWQEVIAQDHYGNIMTVSCLVNGSGAICFGEPDEWYAPVNDFISWMPLPEPYRPAT